MTISLQQQYGANSVCFGCGPANPQGLHIQSFVEGNNVVARWHPQPYHHAFPNVLNGGIIGTLLDCHCNWTAAWALMQTHQLTHTPCTVTAEYTIKLLRPTPMNNELILTAYCEQIDGQRATISGELHTQEKVTATCQGIFVAVDETHPAYHRWA